MTSLFDTLVYRRRNHTPWARMSLVQFIRDMAIGSKEGEPITLSVRYRHSVASRFWWEIEWTRHDGEKFSVSAQELDLCLWRAAEVELLEGRKEEGAVIDEGGQKMIDWLTKTKHDYLSYQKRIGTTDDTRPIAEGITNETVDEMFAEIEALRLELAQLKVQIEGSRK